MSECPFCNLKHKSDWYSVSKENIVVCRDMDNKGYKYRLLVVGNGEKWHKSDFSTGVKMEFVEKGTDIAEAHIANGWAEKIVKVNREMKIKGHWHCQICLR